MDFQLSRFLPALPEIFVLVAICSIMLADIFLGKRFKMLTYVLLQSTLVITVLLVIHQFDHPTTILFNGTYIIDRLALLMKLLICVFSFMSFFYARSYLPKIGVASGEYYILGLFSVLGMMVLVSAHHFITLYLGLELFSLPLSAMIALRKDSVVCTEAALKYFITGSLASGILLYGLSMLYGAAHSLDITQVAAHILQTSMNQEIILVFGLVFVVVAIAFKLGSVPFHMWVPDVYEGSPTPMVIFLGTAPKIAALALAFRLLGDGLSSLSHHWQQMFMVISVLSMALGNLAAIVQSNIKRMLAYSSIAHMGYMMLGLVVATPQGYGAALFYMMNYALMTVAAFGLVAIMNQAGYESNQIDDLRGLNTRNPWLALMMLLTMFSLAGIPPIIGFMAKVSVIEALIGVHFIWLAVLALLFAIIGVYYYIRVVKVMYFEKPIDSTSILCAKDMRILLTFNGCILLALGIFPGYLLTLCQSAF